MNKSLEIIFPTREEKTLKVRIERKENLKKIFENLARNSNFFCDFLKNKGMTDEGPMMIVCNNKMINYNQLKDVLVGPGDKIYFIPPILGG